MRTSLFLILFLSYTCCKSAITPILPSDSLLLDSTVVIETVAFGSCNKQYLAQPLWKEILKNQPDLWLWLGDNIYSDTEDMSKMRMDYQKQLSHPQYLELTKTTPVLGIWDDHDYGANNAGKEYPKKVESKIEMLRFLGVPSTHPVWNYEGAYQSYTIGPKGKRIKFLFLDARTFRDERPPNNANQSELDTADILGKEQWIWLEKELDPASADLFILASGIQFLPEEHPYEKWANFPSAREKLLSLIEEQKPGPIVLLSGDRHLGEVSQVLFPGIPYPLTEVTSSGLTHSYENASEENKHRISPLITKLNFGVIKIDWNSTPPKVQIELRGKDNVLFYKKVLTY